MALGQGDHPFVLTSSDGRAWRREDLPAAEFFSGMLDAVPVGGGWAAVGFDQGLSAVNAVLADTCADITPTGAAAWTSQDGSRWTRAPTTAAMRGVGMVGIASGPAGLVAVGDYDIAPWSATWTSSDGIRWSRALQSKASQAGRMNSISAFGSGFLAVGTSGCEGAGEPIAWTSPDGRSWIAHGLALGDGEMSRVEANATGAVALGSSGDQSPRVWVTADGAAWEAVQIDGPQTLNDLAVTPTGTYLVAGDGGIWSSSDGRTWRLHLSLPGESFEFVAAGPTGSLAVTKAGAIWVAPPG
ncbi:MAG: hypothetical protein ACXWN2_09790 [Candidatus Limnocylindrales bacterium]